MWILLHKCIKVFIFWKKTFDLTNELTSRLQHQETEKINEDLSNK